MPLRWSRAGRCHRLAIKSHCLFADRSVLLEASPRHTRSGRGRGRGRGRWFFPVFGSVLIPSGNNCRGSPRLSSSGLVFWIARLLGWWLVKPLGTALKRLNASGFSRLLISGVAVAFAGRRRLCKVRELRACKPGRFPGNRTASWR